MSQLIITDDAENILQVDLLTDDGFPEILFTTENKGNFFLPGMERTVMFLSAYQARELARHLLRLADELDPPVRFAPGYEDNNATS